MQPHEVELLTKVMMLLGAMTVSATVAAYIFRNIEGLGFLIGSFVASLAVIWLVVVNQHTTSPVIAFSLVSALGATLGSTLGSFIIAITKGKKHGREAIFITLVILAIATVLAAYIGMFSGYNFQGLGPNLYTILLGILILSTIMIFVRMGKFIEMLIGLGVSAFFFVYLIHDFNKIVDQYDDATWGSAVQVAIGIFLDLLNIFVRIAPYIIDAMD